MEENNKIIEPDNTAVRTALWRALHVQIDAKPHVLEDEIGLKLIAPKDDWRKRPDMNPHFISRLRASIVARSRFVEDLVIEQSKQGISQYVILGAGLDTFAQRRPEAASKLQIFEIDQTETQIWKQRRLLELGFGIPEWLHLVSVDFEITSWWDELLKAGFDVNRPAFVSCTGVTLYLTKDAITSTLKQIAALKTGSKLAMAFYLPIELLDEEDRPLQLIAEKGARASGTPFISFFTQSEILDLASEAGFRDYETVSSKDLARRYFAGRTDNLSPASGEEFLLASI